MLKVIDIPVHGGTLQLCITLSDDPDYPPEHAVLNLSFEYKGRLLREMGLELIRQTPEDQQITVNGRPLLEFLESLGC